MTQVITEAEFERKVLKADKPVLIDFFADWCGPCDRIAPIIDDLCRDLRDVAYVFKMDVDECQEIVKELRIMSIPTIVAFKDGQVSDFAHGIQPKEYLRNMII